MKDKLAGLIKNKYAIIAVIVGLAILLWPSGKTGAAKEAESAATDIAAPVFSREQEEVRLEKLLSQIKGAGRVSVLLSVEGSASRELARSGDETLVISGGGTERVVELYYVNPSYTGAVVVCEGAASSPVRLEITNAVAALTGLGADKIKVIEMA